MTATEYNLLAERETYCLKAMEIHRRLSDLPQPILHSILSFLSQNDAVKTSVLSKSWRYLWYGRPNVEFCFDHFKGNAKKFISALEQTLIGYNNQNLSIQIFILKMPTVDKVSAPYLAKWIPIVLRKKGIELFHLSFDYNPHHYKKSACFDLPSVVFKSEALIEIYLKGCKLNQISCTDKVLFRHLRKLRLHYVKISDETFESIMSSCSLIEEVSLKICMGLYTINVNSLCCSLKIFEFESNYRGAGGARIVFTNVLFTHLKSLKLSSLRLTTKLFDSFSCNFPYLEELELRYCFGGFKEFRLSSPSIKRLAIAVGDTIKVSIDAPNMARFEYQGHSDFPWPISFATTSNKWKSKIVMWPMLDSFSDVETSLWLHKLDECLKALSPSEVSLHVVLCRFGDYRSLTSLTGEPQYPIKPVVSHLELCKLGGLCSDCSFLCEVDGKPEWKWNS